MERRDPRDHLYCVPVTRPDSRPSVFDDYSIKLDFSEQDADPDDYLGTFWKKNTGLLHASSDSSSYDPVSPLDAYDALESYIEKMSDHVEGLQDEAIENAQERVNELS